ncbi:class I SAM-dependent methyltransferase [Xanthomonas sp. XNM01]|uniref:class I SAM-dependent methyltransferase n=1 Tax=Xanthomonas sp. XNM01 TaxID=2769289 RepID=UPI001781332F|nr:class I SAM-dependent methyltransferase [Xanthomonas sp. XNM01]MBD9370799.1 methyltransferase regulatory domain-containing protein [Xanthomonas sp. XNM01]
MKAAGIRDAHVDYVGDVAYPEHFQRELMPGWMRSTVLALGHAPPDLDRPYRWCELGCGGGLSARVAAACNPRGHFTAVDIDPAQIAHARAAAASAGLRNIEFVAADLRDWAAACDDGAPFDFIVLHGLWSWVGEDVREAILAFVRRRLAVGGVLQIGYMSHPGASPLQAAHKLMREAAQYAEGDSGQRASAALGLLRELADGGAGYFAEHAGARTQLAAMQRETPAYLAHEFLGAAWEPQHSADLLRRLAAAGCDHLGSATPLENIDTLSVPAALQPLLRAMPRGPLAETVRDLARNQSQRRDLFQRGTRALDASAHLAALDALVFAALPGAPAAAEGDLRFQTRIGPVDGPRAWFDPVLRALAAGPQSFAALRALAPFADAPGLLNQVLQALQWAGFVHPLRSDGIAVNAPPAGALTSAMPLRLVPEAGTAVIAPERT